MSLKTTPFLEHHRAAGARLIDFGGWLMPVQYSGVLEEHHAVRSTAGLFDVSHMGEVEVTGPDALRYAQNLVSNDLDHCAIGQAQYAVMCQPDGGIVDDLITYRLAPGHLMFCVNASNTDKDYEWMKAAALGFDVELVNRSAQTAQLALQGPAAHSILQKLTSSDLSRLAAFRCETLTVLGGPCLVARTGYTGEDGFELFFDTAHADRMWTGIMAAGEPAGIRPIGLGARDTLRLEMKYSLYGNDIDETTHPLEAGLGWVVKLDKPAFIGRDALLAFRAEGLKRRLVGFELLERNVPRHGYRVLDNSGNPIGHVASGALSPSLNRPIGTAYLPLANANLGDTFQVEIRQKGIPARVVRTPFYKPSRQG